MQLHLVWVAAPPKEELRPAKVIQLDARRTARIEAVRLGQRRPRPAA